MIEKVRICPVCSREFAETTSTCPQDGVGLVSLDTGSTDRGESRIGQVVAGRYRLERVVGRGGMGTVYACRHVLVGKTFAMKVLRPGVERSTEVLQRFIREAQSANAVQSRHICEMVDFGQLDNGAFYVVMELLDGVSLTRALREGRLDAAALRDVFIQIAETLERAHRAGIVHRDLKPDNVILVHEEDNPNFVKLVDFGIAKVMQSEASNLTETGIILGTPYYMSPEQARGESVDARSDIYALGVMMYRAFTGKLPFVADTAMGVLTRHLTEIPELPSRIASVETVTERVILRCMEKRAIDRFQTMSDVAAALRSVGQGSRRDDDRATVDDRRSGELRAALNAELERDGLGHLMTPSPQSAPAAAPGAAQTGWGPAAAAAPAFPGAAPSTPAWEEPSSRPVPLGVALAGGVPAPTSYDARGPYGAAVTGPHLPPMGSGAYPVDGSTAASTGPSGAYGALPAPSGPGASTSSSGSYGAVYTGPYTPGWAAPSAPRYGAPDLAVEAFTARGVVSSRIDTRSTPGRGRRITLWAGLGAAAAVVAASLATVILLSRTENESQRDADAPDHSGDRPSTLERPAAAPLEPGSAPTTASDDDAPPPTPSSSATPSVSSSAARPVPGVDAGAPRPTATYRPPPPKPTSDIRSPFD